VAFTPGQLYSGNWDDDGTYRVVKVLAADDEAVHVRVYKQRFPERPTTVDPQRLTLGTAHDSDGFGVGHLPLAHQEFMLWEPQLIGSTELREEELDGYRMWASEPDAEVFGVVKRTLRGRIRGWLGRD
jgi:hypothetical protein